MPGPWRPIFHMFNQLTRFISISDEMPGPWRPKKLLPLVCAHREFQSQTGCQAPGHCRKESYHKFREFISISDEMPGPWRRYMLFLAIAPPDNFNLRRDARPLATEPLAVFTGFKDAFQSQTR